MFKAITAVSGPIFNRAGHERAALILPLALTLVLAGCSTVDSLVGGDPAPAAQQAKPEPAAAAKTDTPQAAPAKPGDTNTYPNLSNVPDKPNPGTTPQQRRAIQEGLVADREKANHSADALRGGAEPAAMPPPPAPPKSGPTKDQAKPAADSTGSTPAAGTPPTN